MHDPVRQTGQWLKPIVQGHFNYYAVPGNLDSLGVFRDRLIGHWGRVGMGIYYLAWKFLVGFLNQEMGIA